jgi:hypothetical protein
MGYSIQTANVNVATATTDSSLVAAGTGSLTDKKVAVLGFLLVQGTAAGGITFNSKPAGAGTAISPTMVPGASTSMPVFPDSGFPIWVTKIGEGLTMTTGATTTAVTGFVLWAYV